VSRDGRRFQLPDSARWQVEFPAEPGGPRPGEVRLALGVNVLIRGLELRRRAVADATDKHGVYPVDDLWSRAPVQREANGDARGRSGSIAKDPAAGVRVHGHVGAPEAVDRLLGVSYQEKPAGNEVTGVGVAREGQGDLDLQGVCVLELVDKKRLNAGSQGVARFGVVA